MFLPQRWKMCMVYLVFKSRYKRDWGARSIHACMSWCVHLYMSQVVMRLQEWPSYSSSGNQFKELFERKPWKEKCLTNGNGCTENKQLEENFLHGEPFLKNHLPCNEWVVYKKKTLVRSKVLPERECTNYSKKSFSIGRNRIIPRVSNIYVILFRTKQPELKTSTW